MKASKPRGNKSTELKLIQLFKELEIKGWRRRKKIQLIESINPKWVDLAEDWFDEEDYFS